jgi:hypothetical protein
MNECSNILLGELTRSKNNNTINKNDRNSISEDDDNLVGDEDLNDFVMSESANSKSSVIGQFVGECD